MYESLNSLKLLLGSNGILRVGESLGNVDVFYIQQYFLPVTISEQYCFYYLGPWTHEIGTY